MNLRTFLAVGSSAVAAAATATLAAVIDHDTVVPFAQPTPTTIEQIAAVKFKPTLYIDNGCHPYPAVDEDGNTSGGLAPTGATDGGCTGSALGSQIYGRVVEYEGVWALMYSWYMPKDEPSPGIGHRHDWENAVIWVDDITSDSAKIVAISASEHSGYATYYPPSTDYYSGSTAKIKYESVIFFLDHALYATSTAGETQDLIMWDQLTTAAQTALEDTDFGDANVPFKEANFATKVAAAYYA